MTPVITESSKKIGKRLRTALLLVRKNDAIRSCTVLWVRAPQSEIPRGEKMAEAMDNMRPITLTLSNPPERDRTKEGVKRFPTINAPTHDFIRATSNANLNPRR